MNERRIYIHSKVYPYHAQRTYDTAGSRVSTANSAVETTAQPT